MHKLKVVLISPLALYAITCYLRPVPTIVTAHTFCASGDDPRNSGLERVSRFTSVDFRSSLVSFSSYSGCKFTYGVKSMLPTVKEHKRRRNGTFLSSKTKHRRVLHTADQTKTKHMIETDAVTEPSPKRKWSRREGRRIVELGFLVDQLRDGCSECKKKLNLVNTTEENIQGLGSILYVQCEECSQVNAIKIGKTHRNPGKKEHWTSNMGHQYKGGNRFVKFVMIFMLFVRIYYVSTGEFFTRGKPKRSFYCFSQYCLQKGR